MKKFLANPLLSIDIELLLAIAEKYFFSLVLKHLVALGRMLDFREFFLRRSRVSSFFASKHNHNPCGLAWDYAEGRNFWHLFIPRTRRGDNRSGLTWKSDQENRLIRIVHWLIFSRNSTRTVLAPSGALAPNKQNIEITNFIINTIQRLILNVILNTALRNPKYFCIWGLMGELSRA